ncbi:MAG: insulinase family protein [Deltaproteobacteria bacterium]|nr:insulinase family protein [Deltaproteobacteria bacterium]
MREEALRRVTYANGFEFLFVRSRSAPVLAMDLWVRAGSAAEKPRESGVAHLIEHMLFKGTERRGPGAVAREVEGLGGEINAYTSFDHTVYTLVLASRYAEEGVDILSDAVLHSSFDPEELEREKKVVLEEIRRGRDLPHNSLSRMLFSLAYPVHPYGRPVIGREESVSSLGRPDCLSFFRRWYRPPTMTLVAAGEADFGTLEGFVSRTFGRGPRGRGPGPGPTKAREPKGSAFRCAFEARDVTEVYFDLAFQGPAAKHRDVPTLDLLMTVLGQGEASRLQHRVKLDRNLVRSVSAGLYAPNDPGLLYVGGLADPPQFREAYGAICEELFRLCDEPVGARELERARENLEADFVYQRETVQGQAQKAGFFHVVLGDAAKERHYLEALRAVDADALRRAARRYFHAPSAVLALLHPRGGAPCDSDEASRLLADAEKGSRRASTRSRARRGRCVANVLPNGARIVVRHNPEVPVVALRAAFLGGSRRESAEEAGAFHLAASCLTRGTRSRSVFDIAHAADAIGGQIDGFSGRNSFGLKAEFLSKYLEDGLDLFAEVLCYPSFPPEEVEKVREDTLGALRQRKDHPAGFAFRVFEETLYGSHPFGRDVLGTPDTVAELDPRGLAELLEAWSRPENLAIAVAGDVDPDLVHEFLSRALEHLEPRRPLLPEPRPPAPPSSPREVEVETPFEQAHLLLGFLGARVTDPGRFALRVANSLLTGQGGRLFRVLRDEKGLAYAVSSACVEGLDPGYLAAYLATKPENVETAREGILAEFQRLAAGEISEEEVEEAKRKLVGGFEISLQENAFQAAQMALDEIYGLGYRRYESHARSIFAVTREDVVEAARRTFDPQRAVCAVVGPKSSG